MEKKLEIGGVTFNQVPEDSFPVREIVLSRKRLNRVKERIRETSGELIVSDVEIVPEDTGDIAEAAVLLHRTMFSERMDDILKEELTVNQYTKVLKAQADGFNFVFKR